MTYRITTRSGLLALALSGVLLGSTAARSEVIEQILVKINGEILTKTDLETRQVQALRAKGQNIDLATEKGNTELRKALNDITPGLLVSSVDEMLLVQRGKELGYKLSDDQFKRVVDNLKTQNKIETEEQLQAALKQEGMTMAVVTHEMGFARKVANRVVFIDQGAIVEDADKEVFFGTPRSERAQLFLSKILQH